MKKNTPALIFVVLALVLFSPLLSFAQTTFQNISINAIDMDWDHKKGIIRLKGNVQVIVKGYYISTQQAEINSQTKTIQAEGRVTLQNPELYAEGERMTLNYETTTGTIYNGIVQMGQVSFEGAVIEKTGANTFDTIDGSFTACTSCPPAWSFSGTRVRGTFGGYAHIRNPILRVASFPIFWLPYLMVPLNSRRQTGLLFPTFEFGSQSKLTIGQSFYYVIADNQDAQFTLKRSEGRGLKGLVNYRYALSETSRGELDLAYSVDKLFGNDSSLPESQRGPARKRWLAKYTHLYDLPENYTHRAQLNLMSDLKYPRDFHGSELTILGDPASENRTSLTKNSENLHLSVDAGHYTNLLKGDPLEDNRDAVHRLPYIQFKRTPRHLGETPLLFDIEGHYANFTRAGRTYDNVYRNADGTVREVLDGPGSGTIVEGNPGFTDPLGEYDADYDQIRAGQRLDVEPRLSLPVKLGNRFDLIPSLSYRETQYQFDIGQKHSAQRRYVRGTLSARTSFHSVYGDPEDPTTTRYKHEMVPELTYTAIPWLDQTVHPFFGPDNIVSNFTLDQPINDQETVQFDYEDRLYQRNIVTLALIQTLTRRKWLGSSAGYNQFAYFRLAQSYDIWETQRPTSELRLPYSVISALLDLRFGAFDTNTEVFHYPYHNITAYSSRVRFADTRGNALQFTFSKTFNILRRRSIGFTDLTENVVSEISASPLRALKFSASLAYDTLNKNLGAQTYSALLQPPGECFAFGLDYTVPPTGTNAETNLRPWFFLNYGG